MDEVVESKNPIVVMTLKTLSLIFIRYVKDYYIKLRMQGKK